MPRFRLCFQMLVMMNLIILLACDLSPVLSSGRVAFAFPSLALYHLSFVLFGLTFCWQMLLAEPFEDALKNQSMGPLLSKAASVECISPISPKAPDARMLEELKAEPWYQGEMSRKEAEGLLKRDGDFLVRKSTTNLGSFVLTGMHDGQAKHLLLVDPEGTVSTGQLLSFLYPHVPAKVLTALLQDSEPKHRGLMLSGQSWAMGNHGSPWSPGPRQKDLFLCHLK